MGAEPAIRVTDLRKRYRLTAGRPAGGYRTLRESLAGAFRRRAAPSAADPADFWALDGVSFEIAAGEVTGIIGRNGAGKSTLLKILSRITKPTAGRVELVGRVGSLLEVGTGFHPELSGRENVYLNGSILGMSRREIDRQFDAIVAFAEVEKFLDLPVKRYSSGMYVRLAFAVAAHLEPEILIVDEVLAVGDAGFQQKCLGKMRECAGGGRTVLLVSHQLTSVRDLCRTAVWLDGGTVRRAGRAGEVLDEYMTAVADRAGPGEWVDVAGAARTGSGAARFTGVRFYGADPSAPVVPDGPLHVGVRLAANAAGAEVRAHPRVEVQLADQYRNKLVVMNTIDGPTPLRLREGQTELTFTVPHLHLAPGGYAVNLLMGNASELYDSVSDAVLLEVARPEADGPPGGWTDAAPVTRTFRYTAG